MQAITNNIDTNNNNIDNNNNKSNIRFWWNLSLSQILHWFFSLHFVNTYDDVQRARNI